MGGGATELRTLIAGFPSITTICTLLCHQTGTKHPQSTGTKLGNESGEVSETVCLQKLTKGRDRVHTVRKKYSGYNQRGL